MDDNFPYQKAIDYALSLVGKTYETQGEFINQFLIGIGFRTPNYMPDNPAPSFPVDYNPRINIILPDMGIYGSTSYPNETLTLLKSLGYIGYARQSLYLSGQFTWLGKNTDNGTGYLFAQGTHTALGIITSEKKYVSLPLYTDLAIEHNYACYDVVYWESETHTATKGLCFSTVIGDEGANNPNAEILAQHSTYFYGDSGYYVKEIPEYEKSKVSGVYYYGDPVFGGNIPNITYKNINDSEVQITLPDKIPQGYKGAGQPFEYCIVNLNMFKTNTFTYKHAVDELEIKVEAYYNDMKGNNGKWIYGY